MLTNFEFISSNDTDARKKARRHVVKEQWRQKRAKDTVLWQSSQDAAAINSACSDSHDAPQLSENVVQKELVLLKSQLGWGGLASPNASGTKLRRKNVHSLGSRHVPRTVRALSEAITDSSPHSLLGQDHRDPFDSLPVATSWQELYLVYHYVKTLATMIYGIEGIVSLNPCELHFHRTFLHDAMACHAMLAGTAGCIPGLRSTENAVQSAYHRGQALELLRRRMQLDPNEASDAAIITASSLQDIEDGASSSEHARVHFGGVMSMVRTRGGLDELSKSSPDVTWALNWISMITSPESMLGAGWPCTGQDLAVTPLFSATITRYAPTILNFSSPVSSIARMHEILLACEQFLGFFHDLSENRYDNNNIYIPAVQARTSERRRIALFSISSPLHRLLATPLPAGANMYDRTTTQNYCRCACLLNLNLAIMAYSSLPHRLERYLQWLATEIVRNNIDLSMRIEHLYYVLMRGFRDDDGHYGSEDENDGLTENQFRDMRDAGERNWLVSRLLCVAKRLDRQDTQRLWHSVQSTLAQSLLLPNVGDAVAEVTSARPLILDWKDDEMRRAVLGDLYPGPEFYTVASAAPDQFWDYSCCPETARLN